MVQQIFEYLQRFDAVLYQAVFLNHKLENHRLHQLAKDSKRLSFSEYLNATSKFGVLYTSYQNFIAKDASKELSEDRQKNQEVADEFMKRVREYTFNRTLFNGHIELCSMGEPRWGIFTKEQSWQGYNTIYLLKSVDFPKGLPCELYTGSIGYRGNRPTFADEMSRFIVIRVGTSKNAGSTQYGLHKYLRTEKRALFPYYELKFNAQSLPKSIWPSIYESLERFGYYIQQDDKSDSKKLLYIGDVLLEHPESEEQIGNLIEALFAVAIVKEHYKEKGVSFRFLSRKI